MLGAVITLVSLTGLTLQTKLLGSTFLVETFVFTEYFKSMTGKGSDLPQQPPGMCVTVLVSGILTNVTRITSAVRYSWSANS